MTEAVVDHLEIVDVEEQHGHGTGVSIGAVEGVGDPVEEQRPIGQSRQ
jgi:hypothetical protein